MPITVKLGGKQLTHIRSLDITLQIRGGSSRSEANALQIELERIVGRADAAEADQLTFSTMTGGKKNAAVIPTSAEVKLIDDSGDRLFGTWTIGTCFVEGYSLRSDLVEVTKLRGNEVTYTLIDGLVTEALKV